MDKLGKSKFKLKTKVSRNKLGYHLLHVKNTGKTYYVPTDKEKRSRVYVKINKDLGSLMRKKI
jgi:hypothetical protein